MADTMQSVGWHLRYACPFRQGAAVEEFSAALDATWRLRQIDDDVRVGDACGGAFRGGNMVIPPDELATARRTCGGCPANARAYPPGALAGCCGCLYFEPDDPEVEAALCRKIDDGLADRFAAAFQPTTPLGYGLWIASPLSLPQLQLLPVLLRDLPCDKRKEIAHFRRACELAAEHGIPLLASLSPPSHTDFGIHTVFPHCPRCKAGTGERWDRPYSDARTICRACGHAFVPADTASVQGPELPGG